MSTNNEDSSTPFQPNPSPSICKRDLTQIDAAVWGIEILINKIDQMEESLDTAKLTADEALARLVTLEDEFETAVSVLQHQMMHMLLGLDPELYGQVTRRFTSKDGGVNGRFATVLKAAQAELGADNAESVTSGETAVAHNTSQVEQPETQPVQERESDS